MIWCVQNIVSGLVDTKPTSLQRDHHLVQGWELGKNLKKYKPPPLQQEHCRPLQQLIEGEVIVVAMIMLMATQSSHFYVAILL